MGFQPIYELIKWKLMNYLVQIYSTVHLPFSSSVIGCLFVFVSFHSCFFSFYTGVCCDSSTQIPILACYCMWFYIIFKDQAQSFLIFDNSSLITWSNGMALLSGLVFLKSLTKSSWKDEVIIILIHELEYRWAVSTFSPHATFRALSTLLIFEDSRILGYSGPLVNSIWVSDFNELDFIQFRTLPHPPLCQALIRYFRTWAMYSLQSEVMGIKLF